MSTFANTTLNAKFQTLNSPPASPACRPPAGRAGTDRGKQKFFNNLEFGAWDLGFLFYLIINNQMTTVRQLLDKLMIIY